jgi:hypothetical protein
LSASCQAHVHYAGLNGGFDRDAPHDELVAKPGYTPQGAAAASHSVLASGGWVDPNPWFSGPFHLQQVLNPWLARTGYGQEAGWMCLQTIVSPGRELPANSVFTFPGPNATGIPPIEVARESDDTGHPHVPGDDVGLPGGTTTGPYLIVFSGDLFAPGNNRIEAASLAGPSGPVDIVLADNAFLIPRKPLAPLTTYTASATVHFSGKMCTRVGSPSWSAAIPTCPPDIPPFCDPDPQIAAMFGWRVCDPGEASNAYYTYPDAVVTREWAFTTGVQPKTMVDPDPNCRPTITAPRRVRSRSRIIVRYRTCSSAAVVVWLMRTRKPPHARRLLLARARVRVRGPQTGVLILSTKNARPGRYVLRERVTGIGGHAQVRPVTVTRALGARMSRTATRR